MKDQADLADSRCVTITRQRIARLMEQAKAFAEAGISENTRRAYRSDWVQYTAWCETFGLVSLPAEPETIVLYITCLAHEGARCSTIRRRMAAIAKVHRMGDLVSPVSDHKVKAVFQGIQREKGLTPRRKKALLTRDLREMVCRSSEGLAASRDRALLLLGFAGALRRSELVRLDIADVTFCHEGLILMIRVSKTDQSRKGEQIGIHSGLREETCPVLALKTWLRESGIRQGPVFRRIDRHGNLGEKSLHPGSVARIVKRSASEVGLDPEHYAGHSLRAGLVTTAALHDAPLSSIMRQTRHTNFHTVQGYIREGSLFRHNVSAMVSL